MTGDEAFGGMRRLSPCLRSAVGISDFPEKVKASLLTNEIFSKDVAKIRDRTCGGTADEYIRSALPCPKPTARGRASWRAKRML